MKKKPICNDCVLEQVRLMDGLIIIEYRVQVLLPKVLYVLNILISLNISNNSCLYLSWFCTLYYVRAILLSFMSCFIVSIISYIVIKQKTVLLLNSSVCLLCCK